jgi:hypothetical protein
MADTVKLQIWWQGPGRALPRFRLDGEKISLDELARMYGLPEWVLLARIERGVHPQNWFISSAELNNLRKRKKQAA